MKSLVTGIFAALLVTGVLAAGTGQSPDAAQRLKAAMNTEQVDGNLPAAIEQYKAIASGSDRAIAAQALLRLAECYQKLGDAEARNVYQRLVRDYGDQAEAAATARERLAAATPARGAGIVARQLWDGDGWAPTQLAITADGRSVATLDPGSNDIAIRDLQTGRTSAIGLVPAGSLAYAEQPMLSPDQKRVAYAWAGPEIAWRYQVRVAPVERGARPVSLGSQQPYIWVRGWSPDGTSLLVVNYVDGNSSQIGWLSVGDGSFKVIKSSTDGNAAGLLSLSPDGRFIAYDGLKEAGGTKREVRVLSADGTRETTVASGAGTNQSPVWSRDGSHLLFTSDREGSFGLWAVPMFNGTASGQPVRVKAGLGDVSLVGVTGTGALLYTQTIGTSDVFTAELDSTGARIVGTPVRVSETYVGSNVNPSWSPDGTSVAYISHRAGSSRPRRGPIVIRSIGDGSERVVGTTMFQYGGQPGFSPDGRHLLLTARSERNTMTVYDVEIASGQVRAVIDTGVFGPPASALSADGLRFFAAPQAVLTAYDLATGRATKMTHPGQIRAIAASADGRSIAFISHEDGPTGVRRGYLFVANADGTAPRALVDTTNPAELPWSVAWSGDSQFVYFVRGPFNGPSNELRRIAAGGGTPTPTGLTIQGTGPIDVSREGRRLVYGAGSQPRVEVWALDGFEALMKPSR